MKLISLEDLEYIIKNVHVPIIIAIDGDSASGKTTFAHKFNKTAMVVSLDHFYLPFNKRINEDGGHINFDRLISDILIPFKKAESFIYDWYDPHLDTVEEIKLSYKPILILEGAYSLHPKINNYIDLKVLFKLTTSLQKKRIISRSSTEIYQIFKSKWIPMEITYQKNINITKNIDYLINIS